MSVRLSGVSGIKLAIINHQTQVSVATVQDWVAAVKIQVNRDFAPAFGAAGASVVVKYVGPTTTPPAGYLQVALLDNADQAGALGYHDLTKDGLPFGKVFVKTALAYGDSPSVTLSHEVLELLGDMFVSTVIMDATDPTKFWAHEMCDAVEADALGYDVTLPATTTKPSRTVRVSDFVLPQYFNSLADGSALPGPFSFKDHLTGPVPALASGGYMAFVKNGIWSQVQKFSTKAGTRARLLEATRQRLDSPLSSGRRRVLRQIPRAQWLRSIR